MNTLNRKMSSKEPVNFGRGSGRTSRAMQAAPTRTIYIWCNDRLDYPKQLAHHLKRDDLEIVSPGWLDSDRWRGRRLSGIVVDHAARLTDKHRELLHDISSRVVQP